MKKDKYSYKRTKSVGQPRAELSSRRQWGGPRLAKSKRRTDTFAQMPSALLVAWRALACLGKVGAPSGPRRQRAEERRARIKLANSFKYSCLAGRPPFALPPVPQRGCGAGNICAKSSIDAILIGAAVAGVASKSADGRALRQSERDWVERSAPAECGRQFAWWSWWWSNEERGARGR